MSQWIISLGNQRKEMEIGPTNTNLFFNYIKNICKLALSLGLEHRGLIQRPIERCWTLHCHVFKLHTASSKGCNYNS